MKDVKFFYGAASGSSRKVMKKMEEPNVMINYATEKNEPFDTIENLFIDSGGYSFMKGKGEYQTSNEAYLEYLERIDPHMFALRDYPCEPDVLEKHGRTVREHQEMTTERHKDLLNKLPEYDINGQPVAVIQGWSIQDYIRHYQELKEKDLLTGYIGIGSVCRRGQQQQIRTILLTLREIIDDDQKIHAFGVKSSVLKFPEVVEAVDSADSLAYDLRTRYEDGNNGWKNQAFHYLKFKRELDELIASEDGPRQQKLSEMTE